VILNSYAKLNLYLEVLKKRKDSYHNIRTIFERIGLSDKIILKARPDNLIKIICKNPGVPGDSSNLCYRSAKLLQEKFRINRGLDIKIIKHIPTGAGLGGGSSNAAAVLSGLNKFWKLNLSCERLAGLARKIGCDAPFFIYNTPFALGQARGDRVRPLKGFKNLRLWHILVVPKIKVLTPKIYREWDRHSGLARAGLTIPKYNVKILISGLRKKGRSLISQLLFNSLEEVTIRLYPEVQRIKEALTRCGLESILMSGSGPAVFGIVLLRKEAERISRQLKRQHRSWQVFVTRTV
jgi:4-diphosphocytidyl-2-C-methyl-D-erythritol kinase